MPLSLTALLAVAAAADATYLVGLYHGAVWFSADLSFLTTKDRQSGGRLWRKSKKPVR
jgi:hypothetical protein